MVVENTEQYSTDEEEDDNSKPSKKKKKSNIDEDGKLRKGCVKVAWHPLGTEEVVQEKNVRTQTAVVAQAKLFKLLMLAETPKSGQPFKPFKPKV